MTDRCTACPGRVLDDVTQLLGATLNELVPPEAQVHLLNAQRELLLAMAATLEHHRRQSHRGDGPSNRPVRVELD